MSRWGRDYRATRIRRTAIDHAGGERSLLKLVEYAALGFEFALELVVGNDKTNPPDACCGQDGKENSYRQDRLAIEGTQRRVHRGVLACGTTTASMLNRSVVPAIRVVGA